MMRKLYNLLALVSITVTLALMGLFVAAGLTGKLSPERIDRLAAVIRDPMDAEVEPAATQPAEPTSRPALPSPAELEVLQRELDRRQRELEYQNEQLQQLRRLVGQERDDLRQAREAFEAESTAARQQAQDESFQEQVKLYESLQPRQVKDILMSLPPADAARYLRAMNRRSASQVISQFRNINEQDHLQRVLAEMEEG